MSSLNKEDGLQIPGMTMGDVLNDMKKRQNKPIREKKPPKLYLNILAEIDRKEEESYIRLIEMLVDRIASKTPSYSIQFWRDVKIYGLSEAIVYLKQQFPDSDYSELSALCEKLLSKV